MNKPGISRELKRYYAFPADSLKLWYTRKICVPESFDPCTPFSIATTSGAVLRSERRKRYRVRHACAMRPWSLHCWSHTRSPATLNAASARGYCPDPPTKYDIPGIPYLRFGLTRRGSSTRAHSNSFGLSPTQSSFAASGRAPVCGAHEVFCMMTSTPSIQPMNGPSTTERGGSRHMTHVSKHKCQKHAVSSQ